MSVRRAQLEELVEVMAKLRAPDGCPWDRAQDYGTLKAYLIEEAYEVLEVMDITTPDAHREELGDLLLQIVFQAQIAKERGDFDIQEVIGAITDKMLRRHPHVFTDGPRASSPEEAYGQWERIKQEERRETAKGKSKEQASVLMGVPNHLPALLRALRVTDKASRVGFDWGDKSGVMDKLNEELAELSEAEALEDPAARKAAVQHEFGDVLFTMVNLARFLDLNPEEALRESTQRFMERFQSMERALEAEGRIIEDTNPETLDALWEAAKRSGGA